MRSNLWQSIHILILCFTLPAIAADERPAAVGRSQSVSPEEVVILDVDNSIATYGGKAVLHATLSAGKSLIGEKRPVAGKQVVFSIGNFTLPPVTTSTNGKAEIDLYIINNVPFFTPTAQAYFPVGEHVVQAVARMDTLNAPKIVGLGKITIQKGSTKLVDVVASTEPYTDPSGYDPAQSLPSYIPKPPKPTKIKLTVKGMLQRVTDGWLLEDAPINIVVNGVKLGTAKTWKGNFVFEQKEWSAPSASGPVTVQAEFAGDSHYNKVVASTIFQYTPPQAPQAPQALAYIGDAKIFSYAPAIIAGGKATMTAKVTKNSQCEPTQVPLANVKVRLAGVEAVTNSAGLASTEISLLKGGIQTYFAQIADPLYIASPNTTPVCEKISATVVVLKAPIKVVVKGPATAHVGETITISFEVLNLAFNNTVMNFYGGVIGGGPFDNAASQNGIATLKYKIPSSLGVGAKEIAIEVSPTWDSFEKTTVKHPIVLSAPVVLN